MDTEKLSEGLFGHLVSSITKHFLEWERSSIIVSVAMTR